MVLSVETLDWMISVTKYSTNHQPTRHMCVRENKLFFIHFKGDYRCTQNFPSQLGSRRIGGVKSVSLHHILFI